MFRTVFGVILIVAGSSAAQGKLEAGARLKFGLPYTGEISGEKFKVPGTSVMRYRALIPISLKAGQEISLSVSVPGKDRVVGLHLLDPMKKPLTKYDPAEKVAKLPSTEVSAKGIYTIAVFSDAVGPFTLTATSKNADEDEEKVLMEKAKRLRKDLDEVEARLKAIREMK